MIEISTKAISVTIITSINHENSKSYLGSYPGLMLNASLGKTLLGAFSPIVQEQQ